MRASGLIVGQITGLSVAELGRWAAARQHPLSFSVANPDFAKIWMT